MNIILAKKRGFCSGVKRAVGLAFSEAEKQERPVVILHELVHNDAVVQELKEHDIVIVEDPAEAPHDSTLIFSAHGVSSAVENAARSLPLNIIDATCPLVKHVHTIAAARSGAGDVILLAGKRGHREVEGILGRIGGESHLLTSPVDAEKFIPDPTRSYTLVSQTTFFTNDFAAIRRILEKKIPDLHVENTICPSTIMRQEAVRKLAVECDLVIVVGSPGSSNSKRLCETAESVGTRAVLMGGDDPFPEALQAVETLGVTSGASASEKEVAHLLKRLDKFFKKLG